MVVLEAATSVIAGGAFGLALAAPPGPMNAIIAEESVLRGWRAGFRAGLGAMTADVCFFVLSWAGLVTIVAERQLLRGVMVGIGGLLMLYFAWDALSAVHSTFATDDQHRDPSRGFRKAFVLAITNPYQIVFWLTVGIGLLQPGSVDVLAAVPFIGESFRDILVVSTGSFSLVLGLFGGILVWILAFPLTLDVAGRRVDRAAPLVAGVSALILLGFGLTFCLEAWETLA